MLMVCAQDLGDHYLSTTQSHTGGSKLGPVFTVGSFGPQSLKKKKEKKSCQKLLLYQC